MIEVIVSITAAIVLYLAIGVWLVRNTQSRGFRADAIFVLTWGVHFIHETFLGGGK